MIEIKFYGYSDDNIEVEGPCIAFDRDELLDGEEYPCFEDKGADGFKGHMYIKNGASNETLAKIAVFYGNYGSPWSFMVKMVDEDVLIPSNWSFTTKQHGCGYSTEMVAIVDDGCYAQYEYQIGDEE